MLGTRTAGDGAPVCRSCADALKGPLKGTLSRLDCDEAEELITLERTLAERFSETAALGRMAIDETSFLVSVDGAVFDVGELEEFSVFCTDIRNGSKDSVLCSIETEIAVRHPSIRGRYRIASGVPCSSRRINDSQIEWSEPGQLSVFRSLVHGMFDRRFSTFQQSIQDSLNVRALLELLKAQSAFLMEEGNTYTKEDIRRREEAMLKAYGEDGRDAEKIRRYAELLKRSMAADEQ